jgi:hypothetical protein
MALTQQEWFLKLKGFVPSWYFETEDLQVAHFQALAKLLADAQLEAEYNLSQTFILTATDPELDLMGSERNVDRLEEESDGLYRPRVQSLANQSNLPAIKRLVDALLVRGEATILEDYNSSLFLNRDLYASRDQRFFDLMYNAFSIIVDKQVHTPYSFYSRGNYASREDFVGSAETASALYAALVAAVDRAKALGVLYRVVERLGA